MSKQKLERQKKQAIAAFDDIFKDVKEVNPLPPGGEEIWADVDVCDDNPFQPRQRIHQARLQGMVASLNNEGQLHSALARPHPTRTGRYQLAIGHRRKAGIKAGGNAGSNLPQPERYIGKMRLYVVDMNDLSMLDKAYAENVDREDFSVFDQAHYYLSLQQFHSQQPGKKLVSWEDLAEIRAKLGKPLRLQPRAIRRIVGLLDLPQELQGRLLDLNLAEDDDKFVGANEKHCRALLSLRSPKQTEKSKPNTLQLQLMQEIESKKLSGNEADRRAAALRSPAPSQPIETADITVGRSSTSSGQTTLDSVDESFNDVTSLLLEPAARALHDAAVNLPKITLDDESRSRALAAMEKVEKEAARVVTFLKKGT